VSDVSRYLPLSQRPRGDESGVTGDWSAQLSTVLRALADRLDALPADGWDARSGRSGWSVREVVGALEWRLTTSAASRTSAIARRLLAHPGSIARASDSLELARARENGSAGTGELVAAIRSLAADGRRRPQRDLAAAVLTSLDVDPALPIDPLPLGAVALARSLSAPLPIRAVLRSTTLRASDAGWSVGHGEAVRARGADIVLFLYGRSGVPTDTMEAPDRPPS
jgi:hypothetical protein